MYLRNFNKCILNDSAFKIKLRKFPYPLSLLKALDN